MNLLLVALSFISFVGLTLAQDPIAVTNPRQCHCQEKFEVRPYGTKGEFRCFGTSLRIIVPCNIPKRPSCKCTDATGILTDHTGTWCTQYGGGREVMRWGCENQEEWEMFFKEYPDQRFQNVTL